MILVDTSVWIRFLSGLEPFASELDRLLARDEVLGHELIHGELLIGDRGGRRALLTLYEQMAQATPVPHGEVVEFVRPHRLHGRGIGWVDAHLLASGRVAGARLWTADVPLQTLARELHLGHQAPR